jgi:hypothetical protein
LRKLYKPHPLFTEQAYNIHPTLGLDPDDPAEIERNRKLKWSMADLFRNYPVLEKWSYPRLEWQHALGGMKPVGEAVEFRSSKGEIVTVRRDSAGMAAVKGEGYECRAGDGKWVKCDVFTGENGVAPHLAKPPAKEYSAVSEFGLFSGGGETYGHIYCIADKCPELRVGESREEALNDNSKYFEQCVKMISAGKPRVWKSERALAFRMYRLSGDIEDTWIIATEPKRRPFAQELSIKRLTKNSPGLRAQFAALDAARMAAATVEEADEPTLLDPTTKKE